MTEFFRTHMGQRFYEHTMPELVRQLTRLNDNLERALELASAAGVPSVGSRDEIGGDAASVDDGAEDRTG